MRWFFTSTRLQDLTVQTVGFELGRDTELAFEDLAAGAILTQGRVGLTALYVQPHQRAMHAFLKRIQSEKAIGGTNGLFVRTLVYVMAGERLERVNRAAAFSRPIASHQTRARRP